MLKFKSYAINYTDYVITGENTWFHAGYNSTLSLQWQIGDWNETGYYLSPDTYNYNVIGDLQPDVDGDLIITAAWGGGFTITRLQNDGSFLPLYKPKIRLIKK